MNNRLKDALMYCGVHESVQRFDPRYWEIELMKMVNKGSVGGTIFALQVMNKRGMTKRSCLL